MGSQVYRHADKAVEIIGEWRLEFIYQDVGSPLPMMIALIKSYLKESQEVKFLLCGIWFLFFLSHYWCLFPQKFIVNEYSST